MTLTFVVPMPPNVTNRTRGSTHWRRAHREKAGYWETLDTMCGPKSWTVRGAKGDVTYMVPSPPKQPWTFATIRSVMHLGGAMDDDNALARHKPLLDWLVKRGFLENDRKKNLAWAGFPEQVVKRDGNYRIEITLERGDAQEAA
ncbi:MAG: hypothetical protein ACYC3F_16785 [Gemmatimonadaceae bacterium]